jgi:hypothetical protein
VKVGVIPPAPIEALLAGGHQVVNLWTAFFLAAPEGTDSAPAPLRDSSRPETPWGRFLVEAPSALGVEEIVHPAQGMAPATGRAVEALRAAGVALRPFRFPLLRNLEKTRDAVSAFCAAYGSDPGAVGSILEQWSHARISLKRMDALQGRNAAYPSLHYIETLVRAMDPMGDMEGLRKCVESRILENQGFVRESWARLAWIGIPSRRRELWAALEEMNAVVVYDEWGTECNALHPVHDLAALWNHCSLPFGLKPRQERILREFSGRKIQGVLWGAEGLADSLREEAFFRTAFGVPVHTVDNARVGPLDPRERESLARFINGCDRRRAGS